jgi:hypothetical protein
MKSEVKKAFIGICGVAAATLFFGAMSLIDSRHANAKPEFATQTGQPCGRCHQNPAGGGALKPFGAKFKENGFKVK